MINKKTPTYSQQTALNAISFPGANPTIVSYNASDVKNLQRHV
jgi:hypothetical protein